MSAPVECHDCGRSVPASDAVSYGPSFVCHPDELLYVCGKCDTAACHGCGAPACPACGGCTCVDAGMGSVSTPYCECSLLEGGQ